MSYKRVRTRPSNRSKRAHLSHNDIECCPIPDSKLKTFIDDNPNASESAQIEAFFGETLIPEFYDNEPNLINTCPIKMAEYRRQRQLIAKIKSIKKEKTTVVKNVGESSLVFSNFYSEPLVTVLIRIESTRKASIEDIKTNLKHLGTIEDIVLYNNGYDWQMAFVRFESSDSALKLCQIYREIQFSYNSQKNIRIKVFPKPSLCSVGGYELLAFMRPIDEPLLLQNVRNALKSGQHFNEMKKFLLLNEVDYENRMKLCFKLESILNENKIKCKFHVFGSTVNELGFCDSDIDVFIEIFEENNLTDKMDASIAISYLIQMKQILGKTLRMYIRPTIRSRRCPLLKLDFRQFGDSLRANGITCDLSLVNSLGINNSKLIAFYCKLEPRFQTLGVILRYLAKINGFIGSSQMSSYAFSMLIIFFSQSLNEPLLPTVDELMELKTTEVIRNGVECGFLDDWQFYQRISYELNEFSENYLFQLFFQFYANFDFRSRVICPRKGKSILKSKFANYLESEGISNVHEFQMTELMCIQDPFDLTFNMTHHMPYKLFLELRSWFMKVHTNSQYYFSEEYITDENIKSFMDFLETKNEALIYVKNETNKEMTPKIEDNLERRDVEIMETNVRKYLIAKLTTNFEPNISEDDKNTKLDDWALKVSHFFRILFREGFKMKCIYDSKPKSKIRLNKRTTFETYVIKFNTSDRRLIDWRVRKQTENEMATHLLAQDFIRTQTFISDAIIDNSEHCLIIDDNSEEIRIELELSLDNENLMFINITDIKPKDGSNLSQQLIEFICETFRLGLETEQLLTIDDDIFFI